MKDAAPLALVLLLILIGSGIAAVSTYRLDPIRDFLNADGSIRLTGEISGSFMDYLLHGPRAAPTWTVSVVPRLGGTMAWSLTKTDAPALTAPVMPSENTARPDLITELSDVARHLSEAAGAIKSGLVYLLFGWWTQDAAAACTGGTCYYIGGTGNFNDGAHWSTTSGGAACSCTPGSTDAIVFDASSGAGTAVENVGTFTSGPVDMTNSSVTVDGPNNTTNVWKVGGNWSSPNGHLATFSTSTLTIEFTANATITTNVPGLGGKTFYNLYIDASTTSTLGNTLGVQNQLTVYGTIAGSSKTVYINGGAGQPIVGTGNLGPETYQFVSASGTSAEIPATLNWSQATIIFEANVTVAAPGYHYQLVSGNLSAASISFLVLASKPEYFDSGTHNVTLTGLLTDNPQAPSTAYGVLATSGIWSIGGLSFNFSNSANAYIQFGSTTWTVTGNWTNLSTSANWNPGTSTVTFKSAASIVPHFASTSLSANEFYNLIFDTTSASAITYTMQVNGIHIGNVLTVRDTAVGGAGVTFDPSTSNHPIVAGGVVITTGGTLPGRTTTITTGSWDQRNGTYVYASGTVVFASNGTAYAANINSVTVNAGVTLTLADATFIHDKLTVNGAIVAATGGQQALTVTGISTTGAPASFFTMGGSADMTQSGYLTLVYEGASATFAVPGGAYHHLAVEGNDKTAYLQGNMTTPLCGGTIDCAFIIRPADNGSQYTITFDANGYDMRVGGAFYIGDGNTPRATFYAGSGTITGYGIIPNGEGTMHFQTAHIVAKNSAYYTGVYSMILISAVGAAGIYAEQSTVTLDGGLWAQTAADYINFGSSVWTVGGRWRDQSTSATWDASTSSVTLAGTGTYSSGHALHDVTISGTTTLTTSLRFTGTLELTGTLVSGTISATGWTIQNGAGNSFTISSVSSWTTGTYTWNFASTGTSADTITVRTGYTDERGYVVTRNYQFVTNRALEPDGDAAFSFTPAVGSAIMTLSIHKSLEESLPGITATITLFLAALALGGFLFVAVWIHRRRVN